MSNTTETPFSEWCVVEIMGHKKFAGKVTSQEIAGCGFLRIDVPEFDGQPAFTKLFGTQSVYCLSPCTEETARAFVKHFRSESFSRYEAPRLESALTPAQSRAQIVDEEYDEDVSDDDADWA